MRDEDLYDEAHTMQAMSTYDKTRMSPFSLVTTKIPPSFDGKTSWLANEDAIYDWCDITDLDDEKRGPSLRNKLEGDAAIYKKILDRDALKNKEDGVLYFKRMLRPFFVKGNANVFLDRFQQFMNLRRGSSNLMKWMSRFQIQLKRLEEAWGDTLTPISDPAHDEVRQYTQSLFTEGRQAMTAAQILTAVNERRRQAHFEKVPLTKNLIGLLFVSHAELSFDQRMSLTSIMAHRGIDLVGLDAGTLRDMFIEMFCNSRTVVDNPLLNNTGHGGARSFIVIDEGELDGSFGFWAEDEDDGAEGFLDAHEDTFHFTMNKTIHGSSVALKAEDQEKAKGKDAVERAAAEAVGSGDSLNLAERKRATTRRTTVSLTTGRGRLKRPGGGKMAGQVSQTQQTHGATFGGPVNTGEPDVAPDADADHPEIPRSDEPDDAAQLVDNDGGGSAEGGSLDGEVSQEKDSLSYSS
ncbi:unnamed protein product, partial [Symbiodinium pilosum]